MNSNSGTPEALTERQQRVLGIVVQEYVETAQPVGSSTNVNQHELSVSPATLRNDLAALYPQGSLTHPPTHEAGAPTDPGARQGGS